MKRRPGLHHPKFVFSRSDMERSAHVVKNRNESADENMEEGYGYYMVIGWLL